ncbi:GNAT family N-acetyltransferase [Streptomyces sp. NRRL S-340]|uniref:GNAT family N-acetyltransferase n=1 Tax=Streptomyces sp. NRRL S-340 TaxID=1463901 RepID=UPI00055DD0A4|nr:GNAT family N-acetyltransferase [Streptomyces sp. NRRL S-340]
MTNSDNVSDASAAFLAAVEALAGTLPNGFVGRGPDGALLAFTRSRIPALNGILSASAVPDTKEIGPLCDEAEAQAQQVPWSIRLRGEPDAEIVRIAAAHGLHTLTRQAFMLLPLEEERDVTKPQEPVSVRPLHEDEFETFATVLGAAFEAPPAILTSLYTPLVLGRPFVRAYLAEADGVPAAAGLAILTQGHAGLANIGTLPGYRRRGLGRAVTEALLRDARESGAHTAYLHSGEESEPFFQQAGFRTEESWSAFTA